MALQKLVVLIYSLFHFVMVFTEQLFRDSYGALIVRLGLVKLTLCLQAKSNTAAAAGLGIGNLELLGKRESFRESLLRLGIIAERIKHLPFGTPGILYIAMFCTYKPYLNINGLTGMNERMQELGGRAQVLRRAPGFLIEFRCPREPEGTLP